MKENKLEEIRKYIKELKKEQDKKEYSIQRHNSELRSIARAIAQLKKETDQAELSSLTEEEKECLKQAVKYENL